MKSDGKGNYHDLCPVCGEALEADVMWYPRCGGDQYPETVGLTPFGFASECGPGGDSDFEEVRCLNCGTLPINYAFTGKVLPDSLNRPVDSSEWHGTLVFDDVEALGSLVADTMLCDKVTHALRMYPKMLGALESAFDDLYDQLSNGLIQEDNELYQELKEVLKQCRG